MLGMFFAPLNDYVIDFGENKGKNESADDVGSPVLASEDTTSTSEADEDYHEDFEGDTDGFALNIMGKNEGDKEEDGGNDHDVTGREGGLAGAVGASVPNEEFVEHKIGDGHQRQRKGKPTEPAVDFGDRLTRDPLVEPKDGENSYGDD